MVKSTVAGAPSRRKVIRQAGALALGVAAPSVLRVGFAFAAYPDRAIKIVCPIRRAGRPTSSAASSRRHDPLMKVAVARCPESGAPLGSQSTISRLENAPSKTEAAARAGEREARSNLSRGTTVSFLVILLGQSSEVLSSSAVMT